MQIPNLTEREEDIALAWGPSNTWMSFTETTLVNLFLQGSKKRVFEKIKRKVLCLDVNQGGLKMISIKDQQKNI